MTCDLTSSNVNSHIEDAVGWTYYKKMNDTVTKWQKELLNIISRTKRVVHQMFKMAWAIQKLTSDLVNSNINSVIKYVVEPKGDKYELSQHILTCTFAYRG